MFWRAALAGAALMASGVVSLASADEWVPIGTRTLDLSRGYDSVELKGAKGAYKAFRVVLSEGEMALSNIQVRYSNGTAHEERRPINLFRGERTKPIDQRDAERFVEGMTFCFSAKRGATAHVTVQGLQSPRGARETRPAITQAMSWPPACPGAPATNTASSAAAPSNAGPLPATPTAPVPTTAVPGQQVGNGAVLFGVQNVGFLRDRDVIRVGSNLGQFDKLQMRVLDNDIFINELDVVYADGTTQKLVVGSDVKQNTRTKWLDLKGDKFIKEINMTYRSRPSLKNGQARIEVYGQYAEGWLGPNGRGRQFNEGWVLLGAQTAGRFLRTETDVIPVGRNEGQFKRIRVTVKDRALVFDELRIVYNNNEEEVIPVKATVPANSTYGPVDLKAGTRSIKEIRARYRSAVIDSKAVGRGASVVEIWAQH